MENNIKAILFLISLFVNILNADNYFLNSEIRQGELILRFSSDIKRVTYFAIESEEEGCTKYVYDIHGGVLLPNRGISHHTYKNIDSFRIAQNSPERLRVVIKSKQEPLDKHAYRDNILVIPLVHGKEASFEGITIKEEEKEEEEKFQETNKDEDSYVVVIDAGHGGKDNGASCCKGKRIEKDIVLSISKRLKRILEKLGYTVYMTRDEDIFLKLPKRTEFANKKNADIFVSIHANASPSKKQFDIFKGIEIYYLSPAQTQRAKDAAAKENSVMFQDTDYYTKNVYLSLLSEEKIIESHKLGLDVLRFILRNLRKKFDNIKDGDVKGANFWVLVGAQRPAILVETGYITHPEEGKNLLNSKYQELLAKGIAEGIEQYLSNRR